MHLLIFLALFVAKYTLSQGKATYTINDGSITF